jgi:Tfp pilus assembly protein PilF
MGNRSRIGLALLLLLSLGCVTLGEKDRQRMVAHRDLGTLYLQRGQAELAIRELRAALEISDRDAETHFAIGEAYRQKLAFDDAERHFLRALDLDPTLLDARLNLGALYLQQERWREALRQNEILIVDPTFLRPSRALVNAAWAQYNLGEAAEAEELLRRALASDGGNFQAHLNLGILLYERQELVEAVREFDRVLELLSARPVEIFGPMEAEARFRLAMAHVRLGQRERAIQHLQAAIDRGGETQWAKKSRDYLAVLR